jgi:hypothetical protein
VLKFKIGSAASFETLMLGHGNSAIETRLSVMTAVFPRFLWLNHGGVLMGRGGHPAGEVASGPRFMQTGLGFFEARGSSVCAEFAGWLVCEKTRNSPGPLRW